jgi:hypothetical protein
MTDEAVRVGADTYGCTSNSELAKLDEAIAVSKKGFEQCVATDPYKTCAAITWPGNWQTADGESRIAIIKSNDAVANAVDCMCKTACAQFPEFQRQAWVKEGACAEAQRALASFVPSSYEKVGGNGMCAADAAGTQYINDVRSIRGATVASRRACMDLCSARSECIGVAGVSFGRSASENPNDRPPTDCELKAMDCDALVKQGLPDGFEALCIHGYCAAHGNCAIRGNNEQGRCNGGKCECWKKKDPTCMVDSVSALVKCCGSDTESWYEPDFRCTEKCSSCTKSATDCESFTESITYEEGSNGKGCYDTCISGWTLSGKDEFAQLFRCTSTSQKEALNRAVCTAKERNPNAGTCAAKSVRGAIDFKKSFGYDDVCSTCLTQPSDCSELIRNIVPNGCFGKCAPGLTPDAIDDYYVMYNCADEEKALIAETLSLDAPWYEKVGNGRCAGDAADKAAPGNFVLGYLGGPVASRQECMDLCSTRSECIGVSGPEFATVTGATYCELKARDCDALANQGLPDGFTRICEGSNNKVEILGTDEQGGNFECWKKMPVVATNTESNDNDSGVNRAKTACMSTSVALAMVGSALLIHLL